jgi:hypothetical protein
VPGELAGDRDHDDRAGLAAGLERVPACVEPAAAPFGLSTVSANAVSVETPRRQTSRSTTSTYGGIVASSVIALSSASLRVFASSIRL